MELHNMQNAFHLTSYENTCDTLNDFCKTKFEMRNLIWYRIGMNLVYTVYVFRTDALSWQFIKGTGCIHISNVRSIFISILRFHIYLGLCKASQKPFARFLLVVSPVLPYMIYMLHASF